MRYLSPTSLNLWINDRDQFYMSYISKRKMRDPQTGPMAVGSAFDAFVKSELYRRVVGGNEHTFEALFEAQVEPQNRDVAMKDGKAVFDFYERCGGLADIFADLQKCIGEPRFEATVEGFVRGSINNTVPFLGKPDIYFITAEGGRLIHDWKVNGFYAQRTTSPKKGYIRLRPGGSSHREAIPSRKHGQLINIAIYLEDTDPQWAAQCSIYAWLLGEEVGADFITAIDQIVGPSDSLRLAQHRCLVSADFQKSLFEQAIKAWDSIQSGHIFTEMSREDSDYRCRVLDGEEEDDFMAMMR